MTPLLTRCRKRWIAACAVALLGFAHAAIASTGCLTGAMPVSESSCEEHRQTVPNEHSCRTHLQAETQILDLAKLPEVVSLDVPMFLLSTARACAAPEEDFAVPQRIALAGAPPPLSLNVLYSRSLT